MPRLTFVCYRKIVRIFKHINFVKWVKATILSNPYPPDIFITISKVMDLQFMTSKILVIVNSVNMFKFLLFA